VASQKVISMQCKARKAFKSEYGLMRIGNIFTCEPSLAKEYARLGNVEILPDKFGPDRIQALTTAPRIKEGKELPTENPPPSPNPITADSKVDGLITMPSASRPGRRSRRKT
jgi:hypothetical protein